MSETEKMVPFSQAGRMLTTGFEWEAGLFIETYKLLSERYSKEEAKEILGKAMYRAGKNLGREARGMVDRGDPIGMAQAWGVIYGMGADAAERLDEERLIFRAQNCAALNLFLRWGISMEEAKYLGDAYCAGDVGHGEAFSEQMHFQHTCRLMHGDDCCIWDFSVTPQEPSEAAVPTASLKD